jgi:putative ABC transport system permease protein
LKSQGNPIADRRMVLPLKTAQELFNKSDNYAIITVKVDKGADPDAIAEKIKKRLRSYRDVKEGEEDFTVQTYQNLISSFKTVLNIVTVVLSGIAAISLIVGGIGIMTTMYTSVIERTRQIGIMKAIGARNENILMIFMFESGFLGLVGGIIGVVIGIIASLLAEVLVKGYINEFTVYLGWDLVFGALAFSFIVGCISGFLPANQAAHMKPVDALRYR